MSLSSYANIQTAIATWLARDDQNANIPDWIRLFEASAVRRLGVRQTETTASLTPSSGSASLPSDYLATRRLTWTGSSRVDLVYVHPSILQSRYPTSATGTPSNYTIEGGTIKIRPVDATALELLYSQKTTAIETTLNWLATNHPDAYVFGALAEGHAALESFETANYWKGRRDEVYSEIQRQSFLNRGPMAIQVAGATP